MADLIDRQAAIDAVLDRMNVEKYGRNAKPEEIQWALERLPSAQPKSYREGYQAGYKDAQSESAKRKMSNNEWIDFLVSQFDVSRTSAKEMLHGMMRWKKEDNFKKQFNGRRQDKDLIDEQPEQDIEHCATCIHAADSEDICILRRCEYAIAELKDCYEPKQLKQQWIPCSERMPEEDNRMGENRQYSDYVLMSVYNAEDKEAFIDYGYTVDGNWKSDTTDCLVPPWWEVIAWMPLPKPYKEDDHD